jgi:serine/threonine-protein kinase
MPEVRLGRYRIKRELGRGAMAIVYEAEDPQRGVDVALKVLNLPAGTSPDARKRRTERFFREARALLDLSHPQVPRVYVEGEEGGRCFFAMELVRGTNLRDRLQFQGPLSLPELVRLALELCDALSYIHHHGVIHRDIKPDNIMLLPDGSCKLMDFGVAQIVADRGLKLTAGFHGSPAYMSPEQVAGQVVDGRSDIYSLAVTLYEAATGRRAVEGDTLPVITHRVTHEYPPAPAGLPPYLQGILLRAMAKSPQHRYATAEDMAADIREARSTATPFVPTLPPAELRPGEPLVSPGLRDDHPVYLGMSDAEATLLPGAGLQEFAGLAAPALSAPPVTTIPSIPTAPLPRARVIETPERPACAAHAAIPAIGTCTKCGRQMCYACFLDVPGRGAICRGCAFTKRT